MGWTGMLVLHCPFYSCWDMPHDVSRNDPDAPACEHRQLDPVLCQLPELCHARSCRVEDVADAHVCAQPNVVTDRFRRTR